MSYVDQVREHYLHDPLCSDEHYAHLVQQAHEADLAAEAEAERLDTDEALILGSLDSEGEGVYPGDMTDPTVHSLASTLGVLTTQIAVLMHETKEWSDACFEAEVELAHAENTIRQLRGDLAFADAAAATDKNGAVRIVDGLVAELAEEKKLKANWVDATLAQRALVHDLETELAEAKENWAALHAECFNLENALGESQDLVHDQDALVNRLQGELTGERGILHAITQVVEGNDAQYQPQRMLLDIRRALGLA